MKNKKLFETIVYDKVVRDIGLVLNALRYNNDTCRKYVLRILDIAIDMITALENSDMSISEIYDKYETLRHKMLKTNCIDIEELNNTLICSNIMREANKWIESEIE